MALENVCDSVLDKMGKPRHAVYESFTQKYVAMNQKLGLKQYLVPYLMSSHPGSTLSDAICLAEYIRDLGYMPEQVQDFYPTPSTLSTCMYYTGLDPRTMTEVYVPKNPHEKDMQRALIQYRDPKNYSLVYEALQKAGRTDLIGFDKKCLIPPRPMGQKPQKKGKDADRRTRTQTTQNSKGKSGTQGRKNADPRARKGNSSEKSRYRHS